MVVHSIGIEYPLDVPVERPHDADPREHGRTSLDDAKAWLLTRNRHSRPAFQRINSAFRAKLKSRLICLGFGSRLIEQALPGQLRGEARLQFHPQGLACEVNIPLSAMQER
jgi:hypothetical protein